MKNFLLPTIFLLFISTSCKKKNEVVPVGTLSTDIGGTIVTFKAYANYSTIINSTIQQLNIDANTTDGVSDFHLWIHPNDGPVAKGAYTNAGLGNGSLPIMGIDCYFPNPSNYVSIHYTSDPNYVQPITRSGLHGLRHGGPTTRIINLY